MWIHEAAKLQWDLIVLPGGALGAYIMKDCTKLMDMLQKQKDDGRLVGACGAAPSIVLASMPGFLKEGATCFPQMAFRNKIPKASDNDVVVHDNAVTSQGIGSALVFALMLVELLYDSERADRVARNMLVDRAKCQYLYFPPALDPRVRMVSENELEVVPAVENEKIGKDEQKMNATSQKESLQLVFGATATTSATTTSSAVPAVPSVATTSNKRGFFLGEATTASATTMRKRVLIPIAKGSCEVQISSLVVCFARSGARVVTTSIVDRDYWNMIETTHIKVRVKTRPFKHVLQGLISSLVVDASRYVDT